MTRLVLSALVAAALLAGCSKSEQPKPEAAAPSAAQPMASASATPPAAGVLAEPKTQLKSHEIPTEEDFENEAEERITAANLELALDELEREIAD